MLCPQFLQQFWIFFPSESFYRFFPAREKKKKKEVHTFIFTQCAVFQVRSFKCSVVEALIFIILLFTKQ